MITFVVCSISPERVKALEYNIKHTIGNVPYVMSVFDNRQMKYGIAKVYNLCAAKAQTEYLCFLHEDVAFLSRDWGKSILHKLKEKECGVIGFTGSPVKLRSISSVHPSYKLMDNHYVQRFNGKRRLLMDTSSCDIDFSPCVTIDGMCMFVRREVWQECPFDEQLLPGFHGYDLDFSLQVAERYQNYVCYTALIEHFSVGSFSVEWVATTVRLHRMKWEKRLPLYTDAFQREEVEQLEEDGFYRFIKKALRTNYPFRQAYQLVRQYWQMTSFRKHSFTLLLKLIGNCFLHIKV